MIIHDEVLAYILDEEGNARRNWFMEQRHEQESFVVNMLDDCLMPDLSMVAA